MGFMQHKHRFFFLLLIVSFGSRLEGKSQSLEYHGYFRSGIGSNSRGGDQICFKNFGPGNEFRLGNECTNYGELQFSMHHEIPEKKKAHIKSQTTFSFQSQGHTSYEDPEYRIREVFIEGHNFFDHNISYWVGQRFYRDVDAHINDFYYFADVSGNGAGLKDIKTSFGDLSLATIMEVGQTVSSSGRHKVTVFDLRLFHIPLGNRDELNFWLAYGKAPSGSRENDNFVDSHGVALGLRYRHQYEIGTQDLALIWGEGLMSGLNVYGNSSVPFDKDFQQSSYRMRMIHNMALQFSSDFSLQWVTTYEYWNSGEAGHKRGQWVNTGVRPRLYFNDHLSLAIEGGFSQVKDPQDITFGKEKLQSWRRLYKMTVSPHLSVSKKMWGRPVLRAYGSFYFWNRPNRDRHEVNSNGNLVRTGPGGEAYDGKLHGFVWGFQGEVWF